MSSLQFRTAFMQAVRALRYGKTVRMHAADCGTSGEEGRQERLHVLRVSQDGREGHLASDLRDKRSRCSCCCQAQRRAHGFRKSLQEVAPFHFRNDFPVCGMVCLCPGLAKTLLSAEELLGWKGKQRRFTRWRVSDRFQFRIAMPERLRDLGLFL